MKIELTEDQCRVIRVSLSLAADEAVHALNDEPWESAEIQPSLDAINEVSRIFIDLKLN